MQIFIHRLGPEFNSDAYFSSISVIAAIFKDVWVFKASVYTNLGAGFQNVGHSF